MSERLRLNNQSGALAAGRNRDCPRNGARIVADAPATLGDSLVDVEGADVEGLHVISVREGTPWTEHREPIGVVRIVEVPAVAVGTGGGRDTDNGIGLGVNARGVVVADGRVDEIAHFRELSETDSRQQEEEDNLYEAHLIKLMTG